MPVVQAERLQDGGLGGPCEDLNVGGGQHADVLGDDGGGRTLGDGEERGIGALSGRVAAALAVVAGEVTGISLESRARAPSGRAGLRDRSTLAAGQVSRRHGSWRSAPCSLGPMWRVCSSNVRRASLAGLKVWAMTA